MGQENNSWFARNRGLVFGFAIAILILIVIVLILVPTQSPISIERPLRNTRWTMRASPWSIP